MKKLLTLFGTIILIVASSCNDKKKEQPTPEPTKKELITGKWLVTHFADDDNNNNAIEESEKYELDSTEKYTLQFNADGTLINKYEDLASPQFNSETIQKWSFMNNETEILLIDDSEPNNIDSVYILIHSLMTKNMVLRDKEQPAIDWVFLEKE